jgi:phosphohistidine phosphatase
MGQYIRQQKLDWDVMYCSPALRAKTTAELIHKQLDKHRSGFVIEPHLYAFDYHEILAFLKSRTSKFKTIALVGHNPAFTDLTNLLADAGIKNIPTTGLVEISLSIKKWADIKRGCGKLVRFVTPKQLEAPAEADEGSS